MLSQDMDASFVVRSFVCRITMGTDRCSWPRTSCSKVPQRAGSEFWVPISLACCPCVVSKALDVELFGTEVKKGGRLPCEQEALTLNIVLCATGYLQVVLREVIQEGDVKMQLQRFRYRSSHRRALPQRTEGAAQSQLLLCSASSSSGERASCTEAGASSRSSTHLKLFLRRRGGILRWNTSFYQVVVVWRPQALLWL